MGDKLSSNILHLSSNIGSHIKDAYQTTGNELSNLSYNFKTHLPFTRKDGFDQDNEIIEEYSYNIKQSIKGLNFVINQNHVLSKKLIPSLLSLNTKIVKSLITLIGPGSLHFDGIEEYFHDFDLFQSTQEIPHVHPKEQEYLVDTINSQLLNYLHSLESLKYNSKQDLSFYDESLKLRTQQMNKYLKDTLKLIKKRNKKKLETNKFDHHIQKINSRSPPLSEKDKSQLEKYEKELRNVSKMFEFLNKKCLAVLPHIMLFLEEFVETLTKTIILNQITTYKKMKDTFLYFSTFYGLVMTKIPEYQEIIESWETDSTATKLTIESTIGAVYDKDPNKLDQDIDDIDHTSGFDKFFTKWNTKILHDKKHLVKSKNNLGVFEQILKSDPVTFLNPDLNILNCYSAKKRPAKVTNNIPESNKVNPPTLPPRTNTTILKDIKIAPDQVVDKITHTQNTQNYSLSFNDSSNSLSLSEDDEDDDLISIKSGSSVSSFATQNGSIYKNESNIDSFDTKLVRIYNNAKNEIQECPVTTEFSLDFKKADLNLSSLSHKLYLLQAFFNKLPLFTESYKTAISDFNEEESGNLSFKQGEEIEILLNCQDTNTLYSQDQPNWSIGKINDRIGFVPNNYMA